MSAATEELLPNGVNTEALFATINAVKGNHEIADFQFRAMNRWVNGTHSRSTLTDFYGACDEQAHREPFVVDADHPVVLTGKDNGPTPVEYLLHALAACITAGIGNIASARGVRLDSVQSTVEGDIDLLGILGLSDQVRNGYQRIRIRFDIRGEDADALREIVQQSVRRSAVFDVLTNGVPVEVDIDASGPSQ